MKKKRKEYFADMKRYIKARTEGRGYKATSRGYSSRTTGERRRLRDIVDDIYDEVELSGTSDYQANIKSAGKRYYIEYFRTQKSWLTKEAATKLQSEIEEIIEELGYANEAKVELMSEKVPEYYFVPEDERSDNYWKDKNFATAYIVRVIVG